MRVVPLGAAALAATLVPTAAFAQELQFDINTLSYQVHDAAGAPSSFGGLDHVGSVRLTNVDETTMTVAIRETPGGPAIDQGFNGLISLIDMVINLDQGQVTGGSLVFEVNPGGLDTDRFEATIDAGGVLKPYVGGGFTMESMILGGMFADGLFANVDVSRWFDVQGSAGLPGSFLVFDFNPGPDGSGTGADLETFVQVPAPATLALLLGAGLAARRRRVTR